MQGRIIHYNDVEGKGLIATPLRQWLFHIGQWRSDVAPSPNQRVRLLLQDDRLLGVERVSSFDLFRSFVRIGVDRLSWPVLITHAAFVTSLVLAVPNGDAVLGALPATTTAQLSSRLPLLLACMAPLLPLLFWRQRLTWLALLLPLAAVLSWHWPYRDIQSLTELGAAFWLPLSCSAIAAALGLRHLFHSPQSVQR
ncbi:MAG: hypothetical protein ACREP4_07435 [Stenotrophomonas sp.]|uniref:hypothetical protein n=1 Tax=Stenotrophomonas sp. TaxID=69392 RepID=UPI003D6C9320